MNIHRLNGSINILAIYLAEYGYLLPSTYLVSYQLLATIQDVTNGLTQGLTYVLRTPQASQTTTKQQALINSHYGGIGRSKYGGVRSTRYLGTLPSRLTGPRASAGANTLKSFYASSRRILFFFPFLSDAQSPTGFIIITININFRFRFRFHFPFLLLFFYCDYLSSFFLFLFFLSFCFVNRNFGLTYLLNLPGYGVINIYYLGRFLVPATFTSVGLRYKE